MGTLKIQGKIKLDQFWPKGKSDADTTKIDITVEPGSFLYAFDGKFFKSTEVFWGNGIVDTAPKKIKDKDKVKPVSVVKHQKTEKPYITTRLQGIDAPELHYRMYGPLRRKVTKEQHDIFSELNKKEYRQYYAETSTVALKNELLKYSDNGVLDCTFVSYNIDKPSDICDVYGRFVGDILVGNEKVNANHWLLENGWVFPAFYDSMDENEITVLRDLYALGIGKGKTLKYYSRELIPFDYGLCFRKDGLPAPEKDIGQVNFPKIYRRQCYYTMLNEAKIEEVDFKGYLAKQKGSDKIVHFNYLESYKKTKNTKLSLCDIYTDDCLQWSPEDIVFVEKDSFLVDVDINEITDFY